MFDRLPYFVAQSSALFLICLLLAAVLRNRAAGQRHAVVKAGFLSLLALPLAALISPSLFVSEVVVIAGKVPLREQSASLPLLLIWLAGASLSLTMLAARSFIGWRILRNASCCHDPRVLAITGSTPVYVRPGASVPMAIGALRRAVVLPELALTWSDHVLDTVLRHEMAHIHRRDCLWNLVGSIVRAVYWFNPLSWWMARYAAVQAELAADEWVVSTGVSREAYAGGLLEAVRALKDTRPSALGMSGTGELERRIVSLTHPVKISIGRSRLALACCLPAALAPILASAYPEQRQIILRAASRSPMQVPLKREVEPPSESPSRTVQLKPSRLVPTRASRKAASHRTRRPVSTAPQAEHVILPARSSSISEEPAVSVQDPERELEDYVKPSSKPTVQISEAEKDLEELAKPIVGVSGN